MSVYRVTEVIGTSPTSWEDAAKAAIWAAARTLRDLRVAEVVEQDIVLGASGAIESFRTKLRLSFKYETSVGAPEWQSHGEKAQA
ncbi:MAG TPA: dodecin family protein [Caulobacteraceae bacterium]|nr:dodecin family protein [Caulobacteraceae bacterium]